MPAAGARLGCNGPVVDGTVPSTTVPKVHQMTYLYALASVPRFGPRQRDRLRAVGVRATFDKDDVGCPDGSTISLRFDAETEIDATARLTWALGTRARLASTACRMALPEMDGLMQDSLSRVG